MKPNLYEILSDIDEASDLLAQAERKAARVLEFTAGDDPDDPGWPAMGVLVDALHNLTCRIKASVPAEIREAAKAEYDEMADHEDTGGY